MKLDKLEIIMISLLVFSLVFFIISRVILEIQQLAVFIQVFTFTTFAVIHGGKTLGKKMIVFSIIAFCIPLLMETLGAAGFFGSFCYWEYTDKLGPMFLGLVAYMIPITWFAFLYCGFTMTIIISKRIKSDPNDTEKLSNIKEVLILLGISIIMGLVMMSWDLVNDPVMVHRGYWYWPGGGHYFGIPIGNYVFWVITSGLVYFATALFLSARGENQVHYTSDNESTNSTLLVVIPLALVVTFQTVNAFQYGLYNVIPWAPIAMSIFIIITLAIYLKK